MRLATTEIATKPAALSNDTKIHVVLSIPEFFLFCADFVTRQLRYVGIIISSHSNIFVQYSFVRSMVSNLTSTAAYFLSRLTYILTGHMGCKHFTILFVACHVLILLF